jgi:hypothetical protein
MIVALLNVKVRNMRYFRREIGLMALLIAAMTAGCSNNERTAADASDDTKATVDAGSDDGGGVGASGLGKACAGNADCTAYGLTCFPSEDGNGGLCSRTCTGAGDCGDGTICRGVQGSQICARPGYCDACENASDCGSAAPICRRDPGPDGELLPGFCSRDCSVGHTSCPAGSSCSKAPGTPSIKDFSCRPDNDTCTGDGSQCSPCHTDADCTGGHVCLQPSPDSERFCAKRCEDAACDAGYLCTKIGGQSLCYADVEGKATPTCSAGKKGFCDACSANWQCASNRCATKNGESFCAQPGTCTKATEPDDCPPGTFCVPTSAGQACTPPLAYKCQLWKACLAFPCGANEHCADGVCTKK